jgi:NADPH-dependent 2,4-dienoyl-CoA reductase/sulfur reductase-like enzyme/nitrite reductase/ring-hydroxylating ferredoxin subunit
MSERADSSTRDLRLGIPLDELPDGALIAGHVDGEDVVVARCGDEYFAIGAHCTHYHGPLAQGLVVGETVRCPWHHACFDLRTGEPVRAPALDPVSRWRTERDGDRICVREKRTDAEEKRPAVEPTSVVIIGGGAAGLAAADMLRREGYDGTLTMLSADESPPCDRPNLSKDYLAGTAKEEWIPLRVPEWYAERQIDLRIATRASAIDLQSRRVSLDGGESVPFGALLLATGAEPVRLNVPGTADVPIHYVRSFADSKAIIASLGTAKRALVVGASFIGLEVAASLRARAVAVTLVAPDSLPLERVMGRDVGRFIRKLHQDHGVVFRLGETVTGIRGHRATLSGGSVIEADIVIVGVGVRPLTALAEAAGLAVDRGVSVNEYLETSVPGIFAAGDIARYPDARTGRHIRIEHWVVAERQGQTVARNMLGQREKFESAPFFWSQHYDTVINYVGHAEHWDAATVDGDIDAGDCTVTYTHGGRTLAVATIGRDRANLEAEVELEGTRVR